MQENSIEDLYGIYNWNNDERNYSCSSWDGDYGKNAIFEILKRILIFLFLFYEEKYSRRNSLLSLWGLSLEEKRCALYFYTVEVL